ncbi:hypothetical protein [Nocardioides jiangxiensis]|uniref:Fis family transcriptional regulator n=1 Tax=Nocardioides jiangxiensis TaxID=3064524 RepID=A0ABT9AZR5_9ACTN|nr:hypothetical protein [Nocardioides sp. WY-20]MDO7867463.1 hypothetical protein [Nocardioides sp. WY-20]
MTHDADQRLAAFLDDLEHEAAGALTVERRLEVEERARAEYARVSLAARLMASCGSRLDLVVQGVGPLTGTLVRVADGWSLLEVAGAEWLVLLEAVETVRGLAPSAVAPEAWPVTARLGLASALRGLAGEPCVLRLRSGARVEGRVGRAGADFVEVHAGGGTSVVVAYRALAAVRR